MSEKVLMLNGQLGKKEKGFHYFVDRDGDVSREVKGRPWSKRHVLVPAKTTQPAPVQPQQVVAESGIGETNEQFKL